MPEVREIRLRNGSAIGIFQLDYGSGKPLVVAFSTKGFVMSSILDIEAAERLGMAAAVIYGVANLDELLEKDVVNATSMAKALGVSKGVSGLEALEMLC